MKKRILLSALFLIAVTVSNAQISQGGRPLGFGLHMQKEITPVRMPAFSVEAMLAEDEANKDKGVPFRFGKTFAVDLGPANSGEWETLENGDRLWRLAIESPGAHSINLTFSKYALPHGARLFIYSKDKSMHIGAFTSANNQTNKKLGTRPVKGESIIVEYYEPRHVAGQGQLAIGEVIHAYKNVFFAKPGEEAYGFGNSQYCHVNVACSQGAAYTDHKNSVVLIVLGGGLCSGALVNNTRQDGTPYILTADHCFAAANDVSTWVYVFNYESSSCSTTIEGPTNNTVSGSVLRAHSPLSDFCLVELNTRPLSSYNPYYAGWSRINTAPLSGAGIHHPAGDVKKISTATTALTATSWSGGTINHWQIYGWNTGSTEGGSSGSPFFDQNKRVIGQLHGGSTTPCPGTNKVSIYGGLWYSWDQCGSTADVRLKDWLDPTNSGVTTTNGGYFVSVACTSPVSAGTTVSSAGTVCTGQVFSLSLSGASGGAGLAYQWQSSSNGSTWTNISGATAASYTTSQSSSTYYRCYVSCGASSAYSTQTQVSNSGGVCYCTSNLGGGSCSSDNITNVRISGTTLNNTSTCNVSAGGDAYTSFPASGSSTASLLAGSTYSLSVTTDYYDIVSVWIDYNRNGVFESSEWSQVTTYSSAGVASSISVTIPSSAVAGTTGMRIRSRAAGNPNASTDACTTFGSGEAEDYTITITQPTPCTAPPVAGSAGSSASSACAGTPFTLSLTGASSGTGLSYQWQSSPNGSTWTSIPGATTSTYSATLSASTYYRSNVTCSGSTSSSSSVLVSLSTNCSYLVPSSGTASVTSCSGIVYDNGGAASNYANSSNGTLTIYPGTAGSYVNLSFTSFSVESCCDRLYVYDGTSTGAPLLGSYTSNPGTIYATNASGALTLYFYSDGSVSYSGFAADISCLSSLPQPDLTVTSAYLASTSVPAGNSVFTSCYAYNIGAGTASSSPVGYYLSSNPTWDATDIYLGYSSGGSLGASASSYRSSSITIPAGTTPGSYYVLYFADYNTVVTESNETNNVSSLALTVTTPTVDLIITSNSVTPAALVRGNTCLASCYIYNQGNSISSSSNVGYYLSSDAVFDAADVFLGSSTGSSLAASTSSSRSSTLTIPLGTATGSWYLLFFADYGLAITETNEGNNVNVTAVTVSDPIVDLIIQSRSISPAATVSGNTAFVSCYIYNQGNSQASSSNVGYYLSADATYDAGDIFLGSSAGTTLSYASSSYRSSTVTIPAGTAAGSYYMLYFADYSNALSESNETNNVNYYAITVSDPSIDLIIQTPAISSVALVKGNTASASCYIYNQGNTMASSSNVGYYLSTDAVYDAADVFLGTSAGTTLSGSSSSYRSATLTIPGGTASGSYYILYFADYSNAVGETIESNNVNSVAVTVSDPFIDLIIQTVNAPSSITAGNTFTASSTIYNQGNTTASSSNVGYYLSTDAVYDAADVFLGSYAGSSLGASISGSRNASLTIPSATAGGNYYLIYFADYSGAVSESVESNNVSSLAVTIMPLGSQVLVPFSGTSTVNSCLGIVLDNGGTSNYSNYSNGTLTIYPATAGNYVRLSFTSFSLESSYDYLYIYDGISTGSALIGTYTGSTSPGVLYATNASGALTLRFTSDGSSTYSGFSADITCVSSIPQPDLTINTLTLSNSSPASGASVSVSSYISNLGYTSSSSTVGYYLSADSIFDGADVYMGYSSGGTLSSGAQSYRSATLTIPAGTTPGSYYILWFADYSGLVTEGNETNNVKSKPITIVPPVFDLIIQTPGVSSTTMVKGNISSASCYVYNQGNSQSPSSNAGFYLSTDAVFDASDVFLNAAAGGSLNASVSGYRSSSFTIPAGTASGSYYILYFADYSNAVSESNETNNVSFVAVTVTDPTVDLSIQTPYVSSVTITKGNSASVSCYIYNGGNSQASSSNVGYYLSSDAAYDAADVFLASSSGTTLNASVSSYRSSTITIPGATASGSYYILYFADYSGAVTEINEANNVNYISITVTDPSVDLLIQTPYVSSTAIIKGNSVSVSCYVYNGGNTSASSSNVGYYLSSDAVYDASDVFLASSTGSSLTALSSSYRSSTITIPGGTASGSYYILYFADYGGAVSETNESNNVSYLTITVSDPSIDLIIQTPSASPASIVAGNSTSLSSYIYNQGSTASASSNVGYYLSNNTSYDGTDIYLGSTSGGSLAGGASSSRTSTVSIPAGTAAGTYYLLFFADYNGTVSETNETNNINYITVTISAAYTDLIIQTPAASPATINVGASTSVSSYITNQGNSSASSSNVGYYLSSNNTWDAADVYLGYSTGSSLGASASSYRSASVTIPAGTATGNYYLLFYADHSGLVSESNESNNVSGVLVTVTTPSIDLVMTTAAASPSSLNSGSSLSATSYIYNQGTAAASSSDAGYYLSSNTSYDAADVYLGSSTGASLAASASSYRSATLTIPAGTASGTYYILYYADYSLSVSESNETNNVSYVSITVTNPGTTYLVPATGSNSATTCSGTIYDNGGSSSNYANNSNGTFTINPGTAGSKVSITFTSFALETCCDYVEVYDGTSVASALIGLYTINPGTVTATSTSGALTVRFVSDGSINYSGFAASISCTTPVTNPDLVIQSPALTSTTILAGTSVTASCTIANTGNASASSSSVGYYLSSDASYDGADVYLGSSAGSSLAASGTASRSSSVTIPGGTAAGSYYILYFADYAAAVSESSESNNVSSKAITVTTASGTPDFLVLNPGLSASAVNPGNAVTVTCTVKNQGTGSSSTASSTGYYLSTNTTFDLGDLFLTSSSLTGLAAGASQSLNFSVTIPAATTPGSYYVLYFADNISSVSESNESNNVSYVPLQVSATTGVSHSASSLMIGVYPNPSEGRSSIRIEGLSDGQVSLLVYDTFGSKVLETEASVLANTLDKNIDLSSFASGIYTLKIEHGNGYSMVKIILTK